MERQTIKKLAMLSLVSMFTLVAAVTSANAQLVNPLRAKIPFDFNVGNQKLAAGEYTFGRLSGSDIRTLSIHSVNGKAHALQSTIPAWVLTPMNDSILVFHKYGDEYFLEQIWLGGEQSGTALLESRAERGLRQQQMAAQAPGNNMSGKAAQPETVNIVASLF